jgi:hypothetical protein
MQSSENARDPLALFVRGKAAVTITVSVLLLSIPGWFFGWFGLTLDPAAEMLARLLGAVFFAIGIKLAKIRASKELGRADCRTFALGDGIAAVIVAAVMVGGLMNPLGWALAAIYAAGSRQAVA